MYSAINLGAAPNDGTGDPLRTALGKCNANFVDLYQSWPNGPGEWPVYHLGRNLTGSSDVSDLDHAALVLNNYGVNKQSYLSFAFLNVGVAGVRADDGGSISFHKSLSPGGRYYFFKGLDTVDGLIASFGDTGLALNTNPATEILDVQGAVLLRALDDPPTPSPNGCKLFCMDDGTGKKVLIVMDNYGGTVALNP